MDRRDVLAASGALLAAALAGCTGQGQESGTHNTATEPPTDEPSEMHTDEPPGEDISVDDTRLAHLAADNAAFALDLHQQLAVDEGGNQFFSPYSISAALAMTYAGARGETREQIRETLRYTLGEDVHPALADMQAALETRETAGREELDAFKLRIANAAWGREGFDFDEEYLELLSAHYGAGLHRADFAGDPNGERERINQWVADRTEDRIDDLLPEGAINQLTALVLVNAIYFVANWYNEFDPEDTEPGTFTALDGTESTVPFMHQQFKAQYASVDGVEAIELPYIGGEVSMVLLLPPEGEFEQFEQDLDADWLFEAFDDLGRANGEISLPKFEFETEIQLSEALSTLGMPDAFTAAADLTGMVGDDREDLYVDEVYHDAFVSIDEEGTEATAATAVVVSLTSMPSRSFELTFDRPFLFCIRDRPTNAILFLGRVVDAGQAQG